MHSQAIVMGGTSLGTILDMNSFSKVGSQLQAYKHLCKHSCSLFVNCTYNFHLLFKSIDPS